MTRLVLAIVLVAGCGGEPAPAHPTPAPADRARAGEPPLTEADCDALLDHVIALAVANPADPARTDDETGQLHAEFRDRVMQPCRAMSRASYACAIGAPTIATFRTCDPDQTSRSNSTSNSNVAPGGISPPAAPRSP